MISAAFSSELGSVSQVGFSVVLSSAFTGEFTLTSVCTDWLWSLCWSTSSQGQTSVPGVVLGGQLLRAQGKLEDPADALE